MAGAAAGIGGALQPALGEAGADASASALVALSDGSDGSDKSDDCGWFGFFGGVEIKKKRRLRYEIFSCLGVKCGFRTHDLRNHNPTL